MQTKESLSGMLEQFENFISTKTVVGEPIYLNDMTLLPIVDVSFGCACGTSSSTKESVSGGIGGKMTPSAVLVIKDGTARLVNIKNQDGFTRAMDLLPEVMDRLKGGFSRKDKETVIEAVKAGEPGETKNGETKA